MKKLSRIKSFARSHKTATVLILAILVGGGYYAYGAMTASSAEASYVVVRASTGNIVQTVTGTGQVSAQNQLDIASKASGEITSISAAVGQHVEAGDLIATIDSTDAARSLETAKIALAKLTQAAKPGDIADAQNNVQKSYSDGFGSVTNAFADLQTIMPGLKDLLTGQTGFLTDQHASYLTPTAQTYRSTASDHYDAVDTEYLSTLTEYKGLSRTSATSSIAQLLDDARNLAADAAGAVKDAQNAITFIANTQPDYMTKDLSTAQTNVNAWSGLISSDVSSIIGAQNSIASNANTLNNLIVGADALDIQSDQLAVQQAQETYDNYFIRAPFAGTVGRIPVSVYSQAANGTTMATVIGDAKVATISLNEVDAAKVKAGQPVSIAFDAIDGFTATGTVESIDLVGTVSQGVVSYNAKIDINTSDPRILPGMSLNVTITTFEKDGVLTVPSSAIKTQGRQTSVQVMDPSIVSAYLQSLRSQNSAPSGTSTGGFGGANGAGGRGFNRQSASSTSADASSSPSGYSGGASRPGRQFSLTIPSLSAPQSQDVTTGSTDGTNSEITSGLQGGEWIVIRTVAASSATASSASTPSILNSLSGNRGGGIGGVRVGGGGGGARGN